MVVDRQIAKLRQGIARLIDGYAEGYLEFGATFAAAGAGQAQNQAQDGRAVRGVLRRAVPATHGLPVASAAQ